MTQRNWKWHTVCTPGAGFPEKCQVLGKTFLDFRIFWKLVYHSKLSVYQLSYELIHMA